MRTRADKTSGRLHRRALAPALVAAALVAACAKEGGGADLVTEPVDFEATTGFLAKASDRSSGESHRFEMSMSMHAAGMGLGQPIDFEAPMATGVQDGDRGQVHMDFGPMMQELSSLEPGAGGALPPGDLSMDFVTDAQTGYIRAPMFATLGQAAPGNLGPAAPLAELGDRWGRIDLTDLGTFSITELQGSTGAPGGADPRLMLSLIKSAEDVEALGSDEIDGTTVKGLGATMSLAELLEAQGVDPAQFADAMSGSMGASVPSGTGADFIESMLAIELPMEVWVDDGGYVRRMAYEMDMAAILDPMLPAGQAPADFEFTMGFTMDISGYGESVEIEIPTDAVDVTDAFRALVTAPAGGSSSDPVQS